MTIDNRWYDDLGDKWWDEAGLVSPLHDINPARFGYFQSVLGPLEGLSVLDVGCGGGILSESFARRGARTTGVDLSCPSLVAAAKHSLRSLLEINYVNARGESLPFRDCSFDAVVSADFLEHVPDLDQVVRECARVLKPGGRFLYDTINRTFRSRVVAIWLLERTLRLIPKRTHDPRMFIKPSELHSAMAKHGIENRETRGLGPQAGPLGVIAGFIRSKHIGPFAINDNTALSYIGYGVKI